MNRRDWGMFGIGTSVLGAVVGAVIHSAFLVIWNLGWLAVGIAMVVKGE